MKRRRLLGIAGASLAVTGCAGRSSPGTPIDGSPTGDPPTDGSSTDDPPTGDSPTVTGSEFSRTGNCEDPESASISFSDDVLVTGCVSGSDSCAEATLERANYDVASDTLRIAVGTVDAGEPNEACTEAIVHRAYELRVDFDGGLPGTVVVVHRGVGDEVEAARAER